MIVFAVVLGVMLSGILLAKGTRWRAQAPDRGAMSEQWVAAHRASQRVSSP